MNSQEPHWAEGLSTHLPTAFRTEHPDGGEFLVCLASDFTTLTTISSPNAIISLTSKREGGQYLGPQPEEPENQGMRIMKLNPHIYREKRVRLSDNFGLYHPFNWGLPSMNSSEQL